jgi:N-acetylmuramoyl-L-alanine amidase|tara:strand:+ start:63 stop:698 length:636 start_codon:yes stop_codon:yes gene_type:complete
VLHSNHFSTFKVLVFLCSSLLASTPNNTAKAVPFTKVILDAGHGGHDFGGTFGLTYEKHLALDVVRRVEIYLKSQGISTKLTRSRDTFISLPRRARIANAESGAIFVSIHFNHARSRKAAGIETFYHTKNKNSLKLAHMIQSAALYKTRANNRGVKKGNFLVLSKNNRPAVLLECAFLTNSSDRYRALDPEYRQRMAEAVAMGIIKFRQSN